MNWILIAYLLGLIFLSTRTDDPGKRDSLRAAWIAFSLTFFWAVFMNLIRAGNIDDSRDLILIQVWEVAGQSLLLGISFLKLLGVIAPRQSEPKFGN